MLSCQKQKILRFSRIAPGIAMATEEHKALAQFIKNVHSDLRKAASNGDPDMAWKSHCENSAVLKHYADCMEKLATTYWEENSEDCRKTANSRIVWSANMCREYFFTDMMLLQREREKVIADKIELKITYSVLDVLDKIKVLDVGSCYNPFRCYDYLDVTAVDLFPANENVLKCDFLNVAIGETILNADNQVLQLKKEYFDAVIFCFVLEYIPSSEQRINACRRAYQLLKTEGLLIIATPDSKHVGANSRIMKCWRYTLSQIGFSRIKYEKFPHMHCMAFRKSMHVDLAKRWGMIHHSSYMSFDLKIPQDENLKVESNEKTYYYDRDSIVNEFSELPIMDD